MTWMVHLLLCSPKSPGDLSASRLPKLYVVSVCILCPDDALTKLTSRFQRRDFSSLAEPWRDPTALLLFMTHGREAFDSYLVLTRPWAIAHCSPQESKSAHTFCLPQQVQEKKSICGVLRDCRRVFLFAISSTLRMTAMDSKVSNSRKVQVVYYLSRGGQLEHPHLLELTISATEGLYLRDVKKRLTILRGNGMPTLFSWSYKRSYKNGYVWQDLSDDDLIFPAHGCEYVVKGSQIMETPRERCKQKSGAQEDGINQQQELQKNFGLDYASVVKSSSACKPMLLEKATEITDGEHELRQTFSGHQNAVAILESRQLNYENATKTDHGPASTSETTEDSSSNCSEPDSSKKDEAWSTRKLHEYKVSTKHGEPILVDNGTYAATRIEKQEKSQIADSPAQIQAVTATDSKRENQQKPVELHQGEVSPPPSSSSSTSPSTSTTAAVSPQRGDEHRTPKISTAGAEDNTSDVPSSSSPTSAKKTEQSHVSRQLQRQWQDEGLRISSKVKHSSASALLQFVSCGGLDVKDEMFPMSLYLKAKGPQHPTAEQISQLLQSGKGRSWCRLSKRGAPKPKSSCEIRAGIVGEKNFCQSIDKIVQNRSETDGTEDLNLASALESALPDVISIPRSSASELRSSNVSRELDFQIESQKLRSTRETKDLHHNFTKSNADISLRISPTTPTKNSSKNTSQELSATYPKLSGQVGENSRTGIMKKGSNVGDQGYQNMTLLWEELLKSKKNEDERPQSPEKANDETERSLQTSVDISLPTPGFLHHLLQECLLCGGNFRPESLKVHRTSSCNAQKSCRNINNICLPKDSNVEPRSMTPSQVNQVI